MCKNTHAMIAISILIFDDVVPSSITGVVDLLTGTNKYLERTGKSPAFTLELVREKAKKNPLAFPAQVISYKTYAEVKRSNLVIIPAFTVGNKEVLKKNKAAVQWIKEMNLAGAEVASLCVGSFFLAEAGLLEGKEVASHWAVLDEMQQKYPTLKMKSDLVITDQDGIYTSGGAFSSLKLILYLIEKFCGRETALWISKMYAVDMDRTSQAHFAVFIGQHQHEDKEILQAQLYIEKNYQEDISMDELSSFVNMGNRTFIRRFKAATNNTPYEYFQRVRIESAKKAIEINHKDLLSIMDDTGYNDVKTFRSIFKRITGLSPQKYKLKYARSLKAGVAD